MHHLRRGEVSDAGQLRRHNSQISVHSALLKADAKEIKAEEEGEGDGEEHEKGDRKKQRPSEGTGCSTATGH